MNDATQLDIPGAATRIGSYALVHNHSRSVFRVFLRDAKDQHLHVMDFEDTLALDRVLEMLGSGPAFYRFDTNINSHLVMNDWQTVA